MMKKSKEVLVRTSDHAPHVAIGKDCYINHDELFNYFKDAVKHAEKELERHYRFYKDNNNEQEKKWFNRYNEGFRIQLYWQLVMIRNLGCISDGKYKWWNNYIEREVYLKYHNAIV